MQRHLGRLTANEVAPCVGISLIIGDRYWRNVHVWQKNDMEDLPVDLRYNLRRSGTMNVEELKSILEHLRFTADLPPHILQELAAHCDDQKISAGEILFREGSENDSLYMVRSGRLALDMIVQGRGAVRILTTGPGEMVGWSALMNESPMTATAVALEDSELIVATAKKLRELCESDHDFGYYLMSQMARVLSKRLLATRLQLLDLFAAAPKSMPAELLTD